jgi:hypothetical protein
LSEETAEVDFTNAVMSDGKSLLGKDHCFLCGSNDGMVIPCDHDGCHYFSCKSKYPSKYHVTCARQAGFEVNVKELDSDVKLFSKFDDNFRVLNVIHENSRQRVIL